MVVGDRITKYAHFYALPHPFKASTIVVAFMETIKKLHENPKIIKSDRDPIFIGNFQTKLFFCLSTQLANRLSYHTQYDGNTEIVNKCLEGYIRCFASDKQTQWVKNLMMTFFKLHKTFVTLLCASSSNGHRTKHILNFMDDNTDVKVLQNHSQHFDDEIPEENQF